MEAKSEFVLSGTNMRQAIDQASLTAIRLGKTVYVYQRMSSGEWSYGMWVPADDPYIELQPSGAATLHCDMCEGEAQAKQRSSASK